MDLFGLTAGAAALGVLAPLQWWNARRSRLPIQVRAVTDTTLHGLVPAAVCAPLWAADPAAQWTLALSAFLWGFLLDMDHVLAFRSLSLKTCSTQERRPFGHGLAAVAAAGLAAFAVSGAALHGAVAAFAVASHVFFDAMDSSGVPLLYPSRRIVRNVPTPAYVLFLAGGLACAALWPRP